MRTVDDDEIARHAAVRFRSEYHYALFEYWRSAKLIRYLERAGLPRFGRVLDDGCGGGGMCVSVAEEADHVVGLDLSARFADAGTRLASEKGLDNVTFVHADGRRLPFPNGTFDTILSHAVIEHVADHSAYLRDARRVLRPDGHLYLQTAPYLSMSGVHLPRLKAPVPLHLLIGRRAAFKAFRWIAANRPAWLRGNLEESSFLTMARRGETKIDDLLYLVTVRNLRRAILSAGFRILREDLQVSRLATRCFPAFVTTRLHNVPLVRDVLITNQEYLLSA